MHLYFNNICCVLSFSFSQSNLMSGLIISVCMWFDHSGWMSKIVLVLIYIQNDRILANVGTNWFCFTSFVND